MIESSTFLFSFAIKFHFICVGEEKAREKKTWALLLQLMYARRTGQDLRYRVSASYRGITSTNERNLRLNAYHLGIDGSIFLKLDDRFYTFILQDLKLHHSGDRRRRSKNRFSEHQNLFTSICRCISGFRRF